MSVVEIPIMLSMYAYGVCLLVPTVVFTVPFDRCGGKLSLFSHRDRTKTGTPAVALAWLLTLYRAYPGSPPEAMQRTLVEQIGRHLHAVVVLHVDAQKRARTQRMQTRVLVA